MCLDHSLSKHSGARRLSMENLAQAYVLLAPEMVIIWAARQHHDANILAEKFQTKGRPSWTKTHAFFLVMGGFMLHAKGRPIRVLEWKDLKALARADRVDWPNISEQEIKDRSKGDSRRVLSFFKPHGSPFSSSRRLPQD